MKIEAPVLRWGIIPARRPMELAHTIHTRLANDWVDPWFLRPWESRVVSVQALQDLKLLRNISLITHEQ